MDFTKKEALKRGKAQKQGMGMSPKQARIAGSRNIIQATHRLGLDQERFGDAVYFALCTALIDGTWDADEIKKGLTAVLGNDGMGIKEITNILIAADILKWYKDPEKDPDPKKQWVAGFRETFLEEFTDIVDMGIENAPAKMLPLRKVPDWTVGETNLNHSFISHTSKRVLDKVPANVLHTANKLQAVKYEVNPYLISSLKYRWNDLKVNAHKQGREVQGIERTQLSMQINLLKQLAQEGKAVQFLITADYRGRFYYRGGLITPQGADFCKAAFRYKKAVKLGKHGKKHLAIHYANVFGKDKISFHDREHWTYTEGGKLATRIVEDQYYPKDADKPYQTLVAAYEWYELMAHEYSGEKAKTFKSKLVCHIDGSCNGLQHGSALARCSETAKLVNCTASTEQSIPEDAYRTASEVATECAQQSLIPWLGDIFESHGRKAFKQAVMITTYGSSQQARAVAKELKPEEVQQIKQFKTSVQIFEDCVHNGVEHVASPLTTLNSILQDAVKQKMEAGPHALFWKTSDGFPVMQAKRSGKQLGHGIFTYAAKDIDPDGQKTAISANFIHSIDADHMRAVVQKADFQMTTVHDSFGCHAGNMEALHYITRERFAYIHQFDYIGQLNKFSKMDIELPPVGDYDLQEIMQATYFFA